MNNQYLIRGCLSLHEYAYFLLVSPPTLINLSEKDTSQAMNQSSLFDYENVFLVDLDFAIFAKNPKRPSTW